MNNQFGEEWPLLLKWKTVIDNTSIAAKITSTSLKVLCAHLMECQLIYNRNLLASNAYQTYTLPIIRKLCGDLQQERVSSRKIYETVQFHQTMQSMNYPHWEHFKITAFEVDISHIRDLVNGQDLDTIITESIYEEILKRVLEQIAKDRIPCGPLLHILTPVDDLVPVYMRT